MIKIFLVIFLLFNLSACNKTPNESTLIFNLNDDKTYVYHDELFRTTKEEVIFDSDIEGDGELILIDAKNNILTAYITSGISTKLKLDPQTTYKIGLRANDNDVLISYDGLEKTHGIDETKEYQLIDNLKNDLDEDVDITKLIRFNGDLYAYDNNLNNSFIEYDFSDNLKIATINSLVDDTFIPMHNLETNVEAYLNLDIYYNDNSSDSILLMSDDKILNFIEIDDTYHNYNVISQIYPPFNTRYLSEDDVDQIEDFLETFDENKYETVDGILDGDVIEVVIEDCDKAINISDNHVSIGDITYIIEDTILNKLESKYFK